MPGLLTRRDALRTLVAAGLVSTGVTRLTHITTAQGESVAIGDSQEAFTAALGEGTALDGGMVQYGPLEGATAVYYVFFDEDAAAFIEADFTQTPDEAVPIAEGQPRESRFLPADSTLVVTGGLWTIGLGAGCYLSVWDSPSLRESSGRSGFLLLIDQIMNPGLGMGDNRYTRGDLMMESWDAHDMIPAGTAPSVYDPLTTWEEAYGPSQDTEAGRYFESKPHGGDFRIREIDGGVGFDFESESPHSMDGAYDFLAQFIPADAELTQTFYAMPTPSGGTGLRIHIWSRGGVYSMTGMAVEGGEENGTVTSFSAAIFSDGIPS